MLREHTSVALEDVTRPVLLPDRMSVVSLLPQHFHQHQQRSLLSIEQAIIGESASNSFMSVGR